MSVFAGRIADAGVDPVPIMARVRSRSCSRRRAAELIWASPREMLNLVQADQVGCHIITMTHDLLAQARLLGKDLEQFSLETVQMFHGTRSRPASRSSDAVQQERDREPRAEVEREARLHHRRRRLHRQQPRRPSVSDGVEVS